ADRHEEDRAPAMAVRKPTPERSAEELQGRVERAEQTAEEDLRSKRALRFRRSSRPLGEGRDDSTDEALRPFPTQVVVEHVGEEREDDREADQIDEDRKEDRPERGSSWGALGGLCHSFSSSASLSSRTPRSRSTLTIFTRMSDPRPGGASARPNAERGRKPSTPSSTEIHTPPESI